MLDNVPPAICFITLALSLYGCSRDTESRELEPYTVTEALAPCVPDSDFGHYPASPRPVMDPNSTDADYLEEDFVFVDADGTEWIATASSVTRDWNWNGTSIPVVVAIVMGTPKVGCHRFASIHHDFFYQTAARHSHTRKDIDRLFYGALRAGGVGRIKAKTMYYGVRLGGGSSWRDGAGLEGDPAWNLDDLSEDEQVRLLHAAERLIEDGDPSLEELDGLDPFGSTLARYR